MVHCVFEMASPHGDAYAGISGWLADKYSNTIATDGSLIGKHTYIPFMVDFPPMMDTSVTTAVPKELNFRERLGIPKDALVFGRYGGMRTFDIPFVQQAVIYAAVNRPVYFLFMNTHNFVRAHKLPDMDNVIFIEGTSDLPTKTMFIQTCDVMLHARKQGETFGSACAEFSTLGRPIITWSGITPEKDVHERAHLEILGDRAITYTNSTDIDRILMTFGTDKWDPAEFANVDMTVGPHWNCYGDYTPEKVMAKFKQVFLDCNPA